METNMDINLKNQLPKWIWLMLGVLAVAFLALAVVDKGRSLSQSLNAKPQNTISMSAEGSVSATPDLATVSVGVTTNAATASAAQSGMNTKTNQVIDFVKKQGILPADITTSNFSVYPNYNYTSGKNEITGYAGNQMITIKVHGVDKSTDVLSKILDGATALGSNQIQGVAFSFNDPDNLKQQARLKAVDKAKTKALDLASATGLKLGKIVSISEDSTSSVPPIPYAMGMGGAADAKSVAPNIQTGSQDVTASMTVTFEIK